MTVPKRKETLIVPQSHSSIGVRACYRPRRRVPVKKLLTTVLDLASWPLAVAATISTLVYSYTNADANPISAFDHECISLCSSRESPNRFKILRAGAVLADLTFLGARTFHLNMHSNNREPTNIPEYMLVRSDNSYPPEQVHFEVRRAGLTFTTRVAAVELEADGDVLSIAVRTSDLTLIRNWRIATSDLKVTLDLAMDERIYGFGDKRAALDQHGRRVEMLNRDAFGSETNESYKSIPFYLSDAGYGLFFHNFYPSVFDVGASAKDRLQIQTTGGVMDFYVFIGNPKEVLSQYTDLTGRPAMLPRWAFGYHQGKAAYKGGQVVEVAEQMRRRKLPFDAIYYDDWAEEVTSKAFIDALWEKYRVRLTLGFGMPMFGTYGGRDDSTLLRELAARGFLMVDQDNRPVIRPDEHVDRIDQRSSVAYLDFFSPSAVDYIFEAKWNRAITNGAILGMVDFGELDHLPDSETKYWPSIGMSVAKTRNLFGLVYPLSVVGGVHQRTGTRSTGMVRPGFAGTQRLGWSTTGDSLPSYTNFRAHMRALLNLTLSGFSNVGQDIGGWDYKGPDILYARWFAAGAFYPFMWSHGQGDHEPYSHGPMVESAAREFLNLRYRLIPYLYSLHHFAHETGIPVLRSFPLQESRDPRAFQIDDQFFVGDDMLVAPIFQDEGDRDVYLPQGLWYDFFAERPPVHGGRDIKRNSVPLDRIPIYVRSGAIIPLGPPMQYTGETPTDPLTVHIYGFVVESESNRTRSASFTLYEDDGVSSGYLIGKSQNTHLRFEQNPTSVRFEIEVQSGDGAYQSLGRRGYHLNFHGLNRPIGKVLLNARDVQRSPARNRFRPSPRWSTSLDSGFCIFIPRAKGKLVVEFAT
jgi:alpha-glucosidase